MASRIAIEVGSHSLRAVICIDRRTMQIPLGFSSSPYSCPSVAVRTPDGRIRFGDYAENWLFNAPGNFVHIADVEPSAELFYDIYRALPLLLSDRIRQCGWPLPTSCVIVIPAYYEALDPRRGIIESAVKSAGIQTVSFISDVAALCYKKVSLEEGRLALAFDLGYSGLTVSVVERKGNGFSVAGSVRDSSAGGRAFDSLIVKKIEESFETERIAGLSRLSLAVKVAECAERVKEELSGCESSSHSFAAGTVSVSREEFLSMATPLLSRALSACKEALRLSDCPFTEISQILLCGGCSNIPCVRELLSQYFLGNGNGMAVIHSLSDNPDYKLDPCLGALYSPSESTLTL